MAGTFYSAKQGYYAKQNRTAMNHSNQQSIGQEPAAGQAPVLSPAAQPVSGPLTREELQLAARNHSLPLEALRRDVTPPGLHYVLTHFDIPDLDASSWHLRIGGAVERALELGMAALRRDPAITVPVTLECAGNGRSLLEPRPLSQPWVLEAVGTAHWTGVPPAYMSPTLDVPIMSRSSRSSNKIAARTSRTVRNVPAHAGNAGLCDESGQALGSWCW